MDYDVIVVGSGFGALTAAALLARRGLYHVASAGAGAPGAAPPGAHF